jgi:predicted DsbA family dithiol-disulfide isomerase
VGASKILVHYDLASTLCYVAHRVMERMAGELAALELELVWSPLDLVLLGGARRGAAIARASRENAMRVAAELRVPVRMPARWLDSRRALGVALALASDRPREAAWRERVFSAIHEEGGELDRPGELERLAADLALDVAALAPERRLGELALRTEVAREAGVSAIPTFMLGEWPIAGIQTEDTMRSLLGRWAAQARD